MHILVTGATGFIGRHICARLLAGGHRITAAVRDPAVARRRFPGIEAVQVDLNGMTSPDDWRALLRGIDGVVNAAGILQSKPGQSALAIHTSAPVALFDACLAGGVRRVVQISAVSADEAAGTEYARTKKAADDYLLGLDLDAVVLRPSLVYSEGSYGGTSMIRGLAGLPWITPLVGRGDQVFQPLHADDLAETVVRCFEPMPPSWRRLDPVGPETLTLRDILALTRAWLDLPPTRYFPVPMSLIRLIARLGDVVELGPMNSTALAQMTYGNVSDPEAFATAIGFRPRGLTEAFRARPSHVQDRWHARLYFMGPVLNAVLALLWLGSGLAGLIAVAYGQVPGLAAIGILFSLADLAIGVALASGRFGKWLGPIQFAFVTAYTLGLTWIEPGLWLEPYGSLLKNLPILALIAVQAALREER